MTDLADDPIEGARVPDASEPDGGDSGPAPAAGPSKSAGDELDELLSQWREPDRKPAQSDVSAEAPAPSAPLPDPRGFSDDDFMALAMQADAQRVLTSELLQRQQVEDWRRLESADIEAVLREAETQLEGMTVPPGFAKRWLWSEYAANPELKQAWDHRYSSEEAKQRAHQTVRQAFKRMRAEAKMAPDPAATEDREAVTAAVRGASTRVPEAKAPDFRGMSNSEYREAVRKSYGFTPDI
jgi:hypothetical protein